MPFVTLEINTNTDKMLSTLVDIAEQSIDKIFDDELRMQIAETFAEMCDPYVPYLTGRLSQDITITPEEIIYNAPYAEEQYERMDSNFTREYHPLATGHWDEVMLTNQGEEFLDRVKQLIIDKANQVYGGT